MLKLIKTTVLDASAASVTISNIPQEFKSLKLMLSGRTDTNGGAVWYDVLIKPNGATTNLSARVLYGNGSSTASYTQTYLQAQQSSNTATASTFGSAVVDFPNYSSTTANKAMSLMTVSENNAASAFQGLHAFLWSSTSAITSITCEALTGNLVAGTTVYLYGVA